MAGQERPAAVGDPRPASCDGAGAFPGGALALGLLLGHHRRDAATAGRAVEQPHRGAFELQRQPVEIAALGPDRAVGVATAGGEIVGADDGRAARDAAPATDVVGGGEVGDGAVLVVAGEAGDAAQLGNEPGSSSKSMRSRQVSLPRLRWRTTPGSVEPAANLAWAMACSALTSSNIGAQVSSPWVRGETASAEGVMVATI